MYPYPVSNSVPGQQGKYRGAKGEHGREGQGAHCPVPPGRWSLSSALFSPCLQAPCPPSARTNTSQPLPLQ